MPKEVSPTLSGDSEIRTLAIKYLLFRIVALLFLTVFPVAVIVAIVAHVSIAGRIAWACIALVSFVAFQVAHFMRRATYRKLATARDLRSTSASEH